MGQHSVSELTKRNDWFRNYQEIPGVRKGRRRLRDRGGFDVRDFAGKTVLDLGSNIGQMCIHAADLGAVAALGVEYDKKAVLQAMEVRPNRYGQVIQYKLDDLDNPLCWHHIEPHDTVLLLSVIDTRELTNRFGILAKACMKCKGVLYLEGHKRQPRSKYFRYILDNTDFTQVEWIGRFADRDLFRCTRDVLDTNGFYSKLDKACQHYNRIAVVGNADSGKSWLAERVRQPGFEILDDCDDIERIASVDRLILFDYRAASYSATFDVLFHVIQPESVFEKTGHIKRGKRSSEIGASDTLRCLYSVKTH